MVRVRLQHGRAEPVRNLIEAGANKGARLHGVTAVEMAKNAGHSNIVALFKTEAEGTKPADAKPWWKIWGQ